MTESAAVHCVEPINISVCPYGAGSPFYLTRTAKSDDEEGIDVISVLITNSVMPGNERTNVSEGMPEKDPCNINLVAFSSGGEEMWCWT